MAKPDYEKIFDGIVTILKKIKRVNGYDSEFEDAAITRKLMLLDHAVQRGLFPCAFVLRKPEGGQRERKGANYVTKLFVYIVVLVRTDQSTGAVPDTEVNFLINDIQKALYAENATITANGGIVAAVPFEPDFDTDISEDGTIYSTLGITAAVDLLIPTAGY